jgi:hypothetical protein
MKTRYNSFLLEKYTMNLILLLEGIYSSSSFLMKIKGMINEPGNVGEMAKAIYKMINYGNWADDDKIKQNYFDTTDNEDKVSFLMNNKVPDDWDEEDDPSLPYTMKGRNQVKIGKLVTYLMKLSNIDVKSKDIEDFVNIYKSKSENSELVFKLVSGKDISKYYMSENTYGFAEELGTLGNSCMVDVENTRFKIYTYNPEKVRMLIYVDSDDMIHGRALVWKLDKSPCNAEYFMDRIYTTKDSDIYKFINYAKSQGWMYKFRQTYGNDQSVSFIYKGKEVYGEISVDLDGSFRKYPFLDTLSSLNKDKSSLSNLPSKGCFLLHDHYEGERQRCIECNGSLFYNRNVKTLCASCCAGHDKLYKMGIETKVNKFLFKK